MILTKCLSYGTYAASLTDHSAKQVLSLQASTVCSEIPVLDSRCDKLVSKQLKDEELMLSIY